MVSPSPGNLENLINTVKYYVQESGLSLSFLAHIRLLVSQERTLPYCVHLNSEILKQTDGLSEREIEAVLIDVDDAKLEKKEIELLKFVLKVVKDPTSTEKSNIDTLHSLGWTDQNIYDAVHEGLMMVIRGYEFKAFKMAG